MVGDTEQDIIMKLRDHKTKSKFLINSIYWMPIYR